MKEILISIYEFISKSTRDKREKIEGLISTNTGNLDTLFSDVIKYIENAEKNNSELYDKISQYQKENQKLNDEMLLLSRKVALVQAELEQFSANSHEPKEVKDRERLEISDLKSHLNSNMLIQKDVMRGLIDIQSIIERLTFDKRLTQESAIESISTNTERLLVSLGITTMNGIGDVFDNRFHSVVTTEPTDNPLLSRHISQSVETGYRANDFCIRPQQVIIYELKN